MNYDDFINAVELFGIISNIGKKDIKKRDLKLSKKYHPDMSGGSNDNLMALKKSYEILQEYMDSYSFSFEESEFKQQFPAITNYKQRDK